MMKADSVPTSTQQQQQQQQQQQRQSPISTSSSSSSNTTTTTGPVPMSPYHPPTQPSYTSTTNTNLSYYTSNGNGQPILEVKSKYDAEFRRFGLGRASISKFQDFYQLVERLHGLNGIQFNICYTDKDGDLLPINNDMNLARVLQVTAGILRLIIQRKGECYNTYPGGGGGDFTGSNKSFAGHSNSNPNDLTSASYRATTNLISRIKDLKDLSTTLTSSSSHGHFTGGGGGNSNSKPFQISHPEDFRPVSAIIDVDIVPDTYRRVRLHKHKSSKPLGFYIRDGRSLRVTPQGVEQVPGIFISRLMPGGLAESTGLLSVNDEVIEVNGIEVAGKTLDQVTDMMVANSSNLIITVKPTNQRYNLNRSHNSTVISTTSASASIGPKTASKSSAVSTSSTPTMQQSSTPQTTAASRLYTTKFSGTHQKSDAPLAPSAVKSSSSSSPPQASERGPEASASPTQDSMQRYANNNNNQNQNQSLQNQHINDDDDDEEEIHDATGANGSYGDDDADPDNSDDKILTL